MVAETGHRITRWCVARNYRSRMMRPGQQVIFWVSGDGRRLARGIWGVGRVVGPARETVAESDPRAAVYEVALDVPLLPPGQEISAADLVAVGITDLEVQRQAFMSNPSWVSRRQLAAVQRLLDGDQVTTSSRLSRPGRDRPMSGA